MHVQLLAGRQLSSVWVTGVIDRDEFNKGEREFARAAKSAAATVDPTQRGRWEDSNSRESQAAARLAELETQLTEARKPPPPQLFKSAPTAHQSKPTPTAHQIIEALETALAEASAAEMANEKEIIVLRELASAHELKAADAERRVSQLEARLNDPGRWDEAAESSNHAAQIADLQDALAEASMASLQARSRSPDRSAQQVAQVQEQLAAAERALQLAGSKEAAMANEHMRAMVPLASEMLSVRMRGECSEGRRRSAVCESLRRIVE